VAVAEETQAVARDLKVSPEEVTEMEKRLAARDLSFDPVPDSAAKTATRPTRPPPIYRRPMPIRRCRSRTPSGKTPPVIACRRP
jgi:hypothetical protein